MLPTHAHIIEVGPRDGLQNEKQIISLADKLKLIELLSDTGLEEIEAGAFVSPKWVPQMADSPQVFAALQSKKSAVVYSALVPNEQGMQAALAAGVKRIAVFTAASETFNQKNINATIAESLARFVPILKLANEHGVQVRGYISAAFVCPYEGIIAPEQTANVICQMRALGINVISIGDTIGKATPLMVDALLKRLIAECKIPTEHIVMHFHDTYGFALTNIYAALQHGVHHFDTSIGGLGGCPYAPGAGGNVATNTVAVFLENLGIATGLNLEKLNAAALWIQGVIGKKTAC